MSMYDPGGAYPMWGEIVPLRARDAVEFAETCCGKCPIGTPCYVDSVLQPEYPPMDPSEGPSQADEEEYQAMVRKYARELDALRGPRQW